MSTALRSRWSAIGAAVAITLGGGGLLTSSASVDSGDRAIFVPITPCRLMDTRSAPDNIGPRSTPIGSGESYIAQVTGTNGNCTIPATATAVSMNVTIITPSAASFLTIWPADQTRPLTANQNWIANQPPTPNAVTVALSTTGTTGQIGIYNLAGTVHIAADIVGYYDTHTHDDRYYTKTQTDQKIAAIPPGAVGPTGPVGPSPAGPTGAGVNGFATRATLDDLGSGPSFGTSIALGSDGLPIVAFTDSNGNRLLASHCADRACTSSTTVVVDDGTTDADGQLPSLAIGVDALPIIVYPDETTGEVIVAHCADLTCTAPTTRTAIAPGALGWITIGADGLPVVAIIDVDSGGGAGVLRIVHCTDVTCTASTSAPAIPGLFSFSAIAIGADGFPIVATLVLANTGEHQLVVIHCTSPTCSTRDAANLGPVSVRGVDIVIGSDGRAIIATNALAGDLIVHHCDDTACAAATRHPVDEIGDVGDFPAIVVGSDGLPIVAYYDQTNADLKVAKCADVACAAPATVSVVDALGLAGLYASMAVAADGLPMISYVAAPDLVDPDVKVAKCGDLTCRPILPG